ncbi:unnamed protein product [Paramecium primaurelia]|uniref:Transmembrane protein n=1 Tax=Paramecium primaurelia TaxID=5886 RepID=A0A8S1N152_PARPR|nr:unnamed protein product [Paramecium primaurelia]
MEDGNNINTIIRQFIAQCDTKKFIDSMGDFQEQKQLDNRIDQFRFRIKKIKNKSYFQVIKVFLQYQLESLSISKKLNQLMRLMIYGVIQVSLLIIIKFVFELFIQVDIQFDLSKIFQNLIYIPKNLPHQLRKLRVIHLYHCVDNVTLN